MQVDDYSFGRIRIGGREYTSDVIVGAGYFKSGWWRKDGHRVQLEDVAELMNLDFDIVIFGTGTNRRVKVEDNVVESFRRKGIEVLILRTDEAVRVYNDLLTKGRRVILAAHLTC